MKLLQAASALLAVQPSKAENPSKPSVGVCTFNPNRVAELPYIQTVHHVFLTHLYLIFIINLRPFVK